MELFKLVASASLAESSKVLTSDFLQRRTNATRKQFYSNMFRLVNKAGLLSRKKGRYFLSNYGIVVFHSLDLISRASNYLWRLKVLDKDEFSSSGMTTEQIMEIATSLIDDKDILGIVLDSLTMEKGTMVTSPISK